MFGLVIMVMVYATGHLSGAHINPAVTIAFTLSRHFPARDALAYVAAQVVGAVAAAFLLLGVWPSKPGHLGATIPTVGVGSALLYEAVLSAFLMFVIVAVATDTRAVGSAAAIAIGGVIALDAFFGGPVTGASMNPAGSLGPALASDDWHDYWIYVVGPVVGAVAGAFAYGAVRGGQARRSSAEVRRGRVGPMAHVLFVCLQNAGRSQISEALFTRAAAPRHSASSAGTTPAEHVHPEVVAVMSELGVDLAERKPRALTTALAEEADIVVTMGWATPAL